MLTIRAIRCMNLRNVAAGTPTDRQDPYVTLTLEEKQSLHARSDVAYAGGVNPHWFSGNWMRLPIDQPGMTCLVQVWDKHSGDADELIASGKIPLSRFDEDGTEDEPMTVDLYWNGSEPAGQFLCIVNYDPPSYQSSSYPSNTSYTTITEMKQQPPQQRQGMDTTFDTTQTRGGERWIPWFNVRIQHQSGRVKEFLVSRTQRHMETGRSRMREMSDAFLSRSPAEQTVIAFMMLMMVVLPWPRHLLSYLVSTIYDTVYSITSSLVSTGYTGLSTVSMGVYEASRWTMSHVLSWTWFAMKWSTFISMFTLVPMFGVLCLPRGLGLLLTRLVGLQLGGYLVSFGTITFVPWITDFKRLKMRFILVDMLLGNPRDKGFTPRFMSLNRVEFVGSIAFSDLFNMMLYRKVRQPLSDVADFDKLAAIRVDHLQVDGLSINLEVNSKNKLNLAQLLSEFDRYQVEQELIKKDINPATFRFPNCLEVQVLGARNLRRSIATRDEDDTRAVTEPNSLDRPLESDLADPYYVVKVRKQELTSKAMPKTADPAFPLRVEQFYVDDASAVVSVELRDENVARPSSFLGRWNVTSKWLLMDPSNIPHNEWDVLSDTERRQGWISFWAPLVDENFRREGLLGDVHLKMRWYFNPALPVFRPGERKETQTPIQQLSTLIGEIRQRLGDLQHIIDILKHIPFLLDVQGAFVLNDTRISIHDLLFGRKRDADNVVKRILTKHRERIEEQMSRDVIPQTLDVRRPAAAIDRSKLEEEDESRQAQVQQVDPIKDVVITAADPLQREKLPRNFDVEVTTIQPNAASSSQMSTSVDRPMQSQQQPMQSTSMQQQPMQSTSMQQQTDRGVMGPRPSDQQRQVQRSSNVVTASSSTTTAAVLSPGSSTARSVPTASSSSEQPAKTTTTTTTISAPPSTVEQRDTTTIVEEQRAPDYKTTPKNEEDTPEAPVVYTAAEDNEKGPVMSTKEAAIRQVIASDLNRGDTLNAVYPEKLLTSAMGGDAGFVRGDLAQVRRDFRSDDSVDGEHRVYLGAEEDDDAAEQRNEDRFDDDEREFDQDGREFIKIRPIVWRKQFMTRHGDPGINVWKFIERLILGLIPRLAQDTRLQKAVAGSSLKGLLKGELQLFSTGMSTRGVASTNTGLNSAASQNGVGAKLVQGIKDMAHAVKNQTRLVGKKLVHPREDKAVTPGDLGNVDQPASTSTYKRDVSSTYTDMSAEEKMAEPKPVSYEVTPASSTIDATSTFSQPSSTSAATSSDLRATRPVYGTDEDYAKDNLIIAGTLEAVWQGRHRITSLFRRWKLWHIEVKGDTVFYHRMHHVSSLPSVTSSDYTWYTLDLTWLSDMFITDSSRTQNNELVLKFVQDDSALHLRLPSRTTSPTLNDWLAAFRRVAKHQQDRRRLGTAASGGNNVNSPKAVNEEEEQYTTGAWPGEDIQPQQRQRGSSLLAVNVAVPTQQIVQEKKVAFEVVAPNEMDTTKFQTQVNPSGDTVDFSKMSAEQKAAGGAAAASQTENKGVAPSSVLPDPTYVDPSHQAIQT